MTGTFLVRMHCFGFGTGCWFTAILAFEARITAAFAFYTVSLF
jgi:hypothetical protein